MKKIAIKSLNAEHGKKIINYLLSLGAKNENDYSGTNVNAFYFISEKTGNITASNGILLPNGYTIVELKEKVIDLKRGDEILVSDNYSNYKKRIFLAYINGANIPVITVANADESNFKEGKPFSTVGWRCYEKIEEEQIVELTMEDISNGKGVGIKPELIRIKKQK